MDKNLSGVYDCRSVDRQTCASNVIFRKEIALEKKYPTKSS